MNFKRSRSEEKRFQICCVILFVSLFFKFYWPFSHFVTLIHIVFALNLNHQINICPMESLSIVTEIFVYLFYLLFIPRLLV